MRRSLNARRSTRRPPGRHSARRRRFRRWRHHPRAYWVAVGLLALGSAGVVATLVDQTGAGRPAPADERKVPVARSPIGAGDRLGADNVEWRSLPRSTLPTGVATSVEGRVATSPIYPGEPVIEPRLAPPDVGAVAARLPPDTRALGVPIGLGAPPVEVGDQVDLLAVVAPSETDGVPAAAVARRAVVVHLSDEIVTVAVERDEVASVALALAAGNVVMALAGPS